MGKISLKAARVNAGYTQLQVAHLMNMSEATIIRWEKDPSPITHDKAKKLSILYNIDIDNIFFK